MKVVPIIQSAPIWAAVNSAFTCEPSVSSRVDSDGTAINDPAALPLVLARLYDWPFHVCLKLVSMSFYVSGPVSDFTSLANFSVIQVPEVRQTAWILTAPLDQWLIAIELGCTPKVSTECRTLANELANILRKSELTRDLRRKTRQDYKDGTYLLCN